MSEENAELVDRNGELPPIRVRGLNGGESVVRPDEPLLLTAAAIASEELLLLALLLWTFSTSLFCCLSLTVLSRARTREN